MNKRSLVVSIDPGKHCGLVIYNEEIKEYVVLKVCDIWDVANYIRDCIDDIKLIIIEDATKNWNPKGGRKDSEGKDIGGGRAQGAGWVKELCKRYFELFEKLEIPEYSEFIDDEISYMRIKADKSWTKKDTQYVFNHTGIKIEGAKSHSNQNLRDALMMFRFYGL